MFLLSKLLPLLLLWGGWWPSQPQLPPEGEVLRQQAIALGLPASVGLDSSSRALREALGRTLYRA
jgi:hypothetical protein